MSSRRLGPPCDDLHRRRRGSIATDAALDELLQSADRALYEVKADGRNGWRLAETADDGRRALAWREGK